MSAAIFPEETLMSIFVDQWGNVCRMSMNEVNGLNGRGEGERGGEKHHISGYFMYERRIDIHLLLFSFFFLLSLVIVSEEEKEKKERKGKERENKKVKSTWTISGF